MIKIKGFVIVLFVLFVIITLFSLLIPSKVMTVKAVEINVPKEKIIEQIADLKNWKNWHPVFKNDSNAIYSNPSTGVNAFIKWLSSNKTDSLIITEVGPQTIKFLLKQPGEKDVENIISILPVENSIGLQVEWRALVRLKWYPWDKFAGIFVDKITGPGYEAALNNLKEYLENTKKGN
jgi:hypothetical protein